MNGFEKLIRKMEFQPDVLYSKVSKILTEAILEGQFEGGQKLVETELQKSLGISRSPLREAIRDLEKKGLVTLVPRRGAFVRDVTVKDIEDLFPVRATLEGLAAKLAYANITQKTLDDMMAILEKMKKAVKSGDTNSYWRFHSTFHEIFIDATNNPVLIETLTRLRFHTLWYRFSYKYYEEDLQKQFVVHKQIYELFAKRDSDVEKLKGLVENHISVAHEKFVGYLIKKNNESQKATALNNAT
jgi:DNA-binding GntR family transcriptional regulator